MRFMMLYKPGFDDGRPPTLEHLQVMGKLVEEGVRNGTLLSTEGLQPSAKGARVRVAGGDFVVTDGPFSEAKELVGGYAILQLDSKEEAIEHAKHFLALMGEGETEIRQLHEASDFGEAFTSELSEAGRR
jgi:hypothetical protein